MSHPTRSLLLAVLWIAPACQTGSGETSEANDDLSTLALPLSEKLEILILKKNVHDLQGKLASLSKQVAAVAAESTSHGSAIAALGDDVAALSEEVAELPSGGGGGDLGSLSAGLLGTVSERFYEAGGLPSTVKDYWPPGATATIEVPEGGEISGIEVSVSVTHPVPADLVVTLTAPDGAVHVLQKNAAGGAGGLDETWTDEDSDLDLLKSTSPTGAWTLKIEDNVFSEGIEGTLDAFSLHLTLDGASLTVGGDVDVTGTLHCEGCVPPSSLGPGALFPGTEVIGTTDLGAACQGALHMNHTFEIPEGARYGHVHLWGYVGLCDKSKDKGGLTVVVQGFLVPGSGVPLQSTNSERGIHVGFGTCGANQCDGSLGACGGNPANWPPWFNEAQCSHLWGTATWYR